MKKRLFGLMVAIIATTSMLFAQQIIEKQNSRNGTPKFLELNIKSDVIYKGQAENLLKQQLEMTANDELTVARTETDAIGYTHERYQQYYQGIEVMYGNYIVHSKNGVVHAINGDFRKIENINTTPSISEEVALEKALQHIGAYEYIWAVDDAYYPEGKIVIVQDDFNKHPKAERKHVLAYEFNIYATNPLSRDYVYVDAHTGKIVHKNAIIKNAVANGQGDTRYSGQRNFTTDSYNGSYRMRDYSRGSGIIIYDMNEGTNYNSAVDFTDNDNDWTAAEYDNTDKDDIAAEAMWAFQEIYEYWSEVHNRDSYDGSGALQKVYVHYDQDYDNAYWNGSVFTFGDGSDTYFDALASLDVSAHEHGHAVCSYTSDLTYSYESGALNEAFSDIWGAAVEAYAAPEKDIWIMGEDIERRTGHSGLRVLSDPKAEGLPDTYQGENWYSGTGDNGGVHTNNGPYCYWFYLVSEGGSGTNDNGDSYNVTGIGINKAEKIAYRVEAHYMTSSSDYADARTYSIQAAEDLYGDGSQEEITVTNAMYAIGVGEAYSGGGGSSASYCESKGNNSSYEWIAQVDIGSYSNSSGAAGYTDFTSEVIDMTAGDSYNITLTPGFASSTYNEYWKIWIDLNNDTTFGADELVFDAGSLSKQAVSGSISIPSDASGIKRMRVSMKYNGAQDACESFSYGEVEDYNVNISSSAGDTQAPTAPSNLTASNITETTLDLSWSASTDNVGVTGYDVYQDGAYLASTSGTSYNVTGLTAATSYAFYVKAKDAAGNISNASNTVNITTDEEQDTQAPTAPSNLASANITQTTVDISWTASSDNVGVTGYDIYQDGAYLASTASTSYGVTGLTASTTYDYFVKAKDAEGNVSSASNTISVTTLSDGGGSDCNVSPVTLNLTFDNYPAETSWTLKDANGNTLYSGSGYSTKGGNVTEEFILDDGNYTFTINDSYGDGICCSYGNGSYELFDDAGIQIVSGGDFGSSETTNFCISGSGGGSGGGEMPTGYCASQGNNANYEWIDLVQLGTIDNSTGKDGGYADYTNLSTDIVPGTQYTINFSAGFASSSYTEYWHVFIDYNRDGDFEDAGEEVVTGSSSSSGTLSGAFTVPSGASLGTTMMRVTMKYNAAATPCESFSYGEVEDYAVNITGQTYGFAGFGNNHIPGDQIGNEESTQVILYPVPVKENSTLNVAVTNGSRNSLIRIYNIHGVMVKQIRINGSKVKINVSDLPQGNYILKMDDPKEPFIKGFIK